MNSCLLIGRVGRNPEFKMTPSGKEVATFSLATAAGKDKADWHDVQAWEKVAANCKYLSKGKQCAVRGRISYEEYTNKEGEKRHRTRIVAHEIEFLSPADKQEALTPVTSEFTNTFSPKEAVLGDDIPF